MSFGGISQHTDGCFGADDTALDGWSHAEGICYEVGARLCTVEELSAGAGLHTGCGHDAAAIWTAQTCDAISGSAHSTISNGGSGEQLCTPDDDTTVAVRCCADSAEQKQALVLANGVCDVYAEEDCTSAMSCTDLTAISGVPSSWPAQLGDAMVCGESDEGLGPDHSAVCYGVPGQGDPIGWAQAFSICTTAGARLCTVEELTADETRGTGCNHDAALVWSANVGDCAIGEHTAVIGATSHDRPDECVADNGAAAVRCCADMETSVTTQCAVTAPPPPPPPMNFCGGFAGITCFDGEICVTPDDCPDCGGVCQMPPCDNPPCAVGF